MLGLDYGLFRRVISLFAAWHECALALFAVHESVLCTGLKHENFRLTGNIGTRRRSAL